MNKLLDSCDLGIRKINRVLGIAAAVMMACMCLHIVIVVVLGKIFKMGFFLPVDTTGYFYLIALSLGYAGFQHKNGFIKITMLIDTFSPTARRIQETLVAILLFAFYAFLTYQCFNYAHSLFEKGQRLASINIKTYWFAYTLAVGFAWTTLVSFYQMVRLFIKGVENNAYELPEEKILKTDE